MGGESVGGTGGVVRWGWKTQFLWTLEICRVSGWVSEMRFERAERDNGKLEWHE
jgi:hypothetical protein